MLNIGEVNIVNSQRRLSVRKLFNVHFRESSVFRKMLPDGLWLGVVGDDVSPGSGRGLGSLEGRRDRNVSSTFRKSSFAEGEDVVEMV